MSDLRLKWTAVPNGVADGYVLLSIVVTPESDEVVEMSTHSCCMTDWPSRVRTQLEKFKVTFPTLDISTHAEITDTYREQLDSDLWDILLSGCDADRFVAFANDALSDEPGKIITTYNHSKIHEELLNHYTTTVATKSRGTTTALENALMWDRQELSFTTVRSDEDLRRWSLAGGINLHRYETDDPNEDGGVVFDTLSDDSTLMYDLKGEGEDVAEFEGDETAEVRLVVKISPHTTFERGFPKISLDGTRFVPCSPITGETDYRTLSVDFCMDEYNAATKFYFKPMMAGREVTVRHLRVERVNSELKKARKKCISLCDDMIGTANLPNSPAFMSEPVSADRKMDDTENAYYQRDLHRLRSTPLVDLDRDVVLLVETNAHLRRGGAEFDPIMQQTDDDVETQALRFLRGSLFHRRVESIITDDTRALQSNGRKAKYNFHERVALVRNHPTMLPALGLTIHARIPVGSFSDIEKILPDTVYVEPVWDDFETEDCCPLTAVDIRKEDDTVIYFQAKSNAAWIEDGALALGKSEHFAVSMLNVDGAMIKMVEHATTKQTESDPVSVARGIEPDRIDDEDELPAPMSAGITVSQVGRTASMREVRERSERVQSDAVECRRDGVPFFFEDLIQGYLPMVETTRVVGKESKFIQSELTRRTESYQITNADESKSYEWPDSPIYGYGAIRSAAARSTDTPPDGEALAGALIDDNITQTLFRWDGWSLAVESPDKGLRMMRNEGGINNDCPIIDLPWRLEEDFRLGSHLLIPLRYGVQYTLRCLVQDVAGNSQGHQSESGRDVRYVRFDPVKVPPVLLHKSISKQDSPGESLMALVVREPREKAHRWTAPPRNSFTIAERHGLLDQVTNIDTVKGFTATELDRKTGDLCLDEDKQPIYRFRRHQDIECRYLPDPMADGIRAKLKDMPGWKLLGTAQKKTVGMLRFYGGHGHREWPNARCIRVVLEGWYRSHHNRPRLHTNELDSRFAVTLPPGWMLRLSLSCGFKAPRHGDDPIQTMGLLCDKDGRFRDDLDPEFLQGARDGAIRAISGRQYLLLVHPVKRPLEAPKVDHVAVKSQREDELEAELDFSALLDTKSTGNVVVSAEWKELDDTTGDEPCPKPFNADLVDFAINAADGDLPSLVSFNGRQTFHSGIRRRVRYSMRGSTRYREFYPKLELGDPDQADDPAKVELENEQKRRHEQKTYWRSSTNSFEIDVPSTVRPEPPSVAFAVPTFGWTSKKEKKSFSSTRTGGGLRVYLNRPWESSGAGELLSVVCLPRNVDPDCKYENVVSRWGVDPIWYGDLIPDDYPRSDNLNGWTRRREAFHEEGVIPPSVDLLGYTPQFDAESGLWWVDLTLSPIPSYFAFTRLALARWQPCSVKDRALSSVILSDYQQLVPDRTVTVRRIKGEPRKLHVIVTGLSNIVGETRATGLHPNSFSAVVHRRCFSLNKPLAWIPEEPENCQDHATPRGGAGQQARYTNAEGTEMIAEVLWDCVLTFRSPCRAAKLVIREEENFDSGPPKNGETQGRIVYADVLEL